MISWCWSRGGGSVPGAARRLSPLVARGAAASTTSRSTATDPGPRRSCGDHLTDPLLEDMLFCPVMYYGSATEHDMEFGQFVIMFKALFLEGFARPYDGVRLMLRVLLDKYRAPAASGA
jgi:hypothetical protein